MKSRMWLLNVCSRIKPEFSDKTKIFKSVYEANGNLHVCERFSTQRALPGGDGNGAPDFNVSGRLPNCIKLFVGNKDTASFRSRFPFRLRRTVFSASIK